MTAGRDFLGGLVKLEHEDRALRELSRPPEPFVRRGAQVDVMELARPVWRRAFGVREAEGRADEGPFLVSLRPAQRAVSVVLRRSRPRGSGLGRRLCQTVLDYARRNGATELVLTSHTSRGAALKLYETLGFRHEALPADVRYETANVFMRLTL